MAEDNKKKQEDINETLSDTFDLYSEINIKAQELLFNNENVVDSFRNILKESTELNDENKKSLRSLATVQTNAVKSATELITVFEKDSKKINKTLNINNSLIKILEERLKDIQDKGLDIEAAYFDDLLNSLKNSTTQLEFYKTSVENASKSSKTFNDKINEISPKLGKTVEGITKNFQDLVKSGILVLFIDSLFKVNQEIIELQKNLGISSAQAQNLRAGFAQTAANAGDLFITSAKLQKAFNEFSGELGGAVKNSGQVLETFTNLTGRFGLNTQEAAKLTSILGLQSENTEQVLENTIKTINASRSSGKEFLNTKQIIKDISNISFNVVATLGKSPDILAKAATRARELGLNLEQVEKIADSLLNFESSISAELTAELLTGKQLNLERARFLALNNDIKGLMEEINKQGINFTEFTKMNRIAQEGLANVLGMSRSEMTEMLFKQEQQTLQIKASRNELDEQTLAQFKALDAQEKFNLAVEKAKAAFSDIAIVLSPILDVLGFAANIVGSIADYFSRIGKTLGEIGIGLNFMSTTSENTKNITSELAKILISIGIALGTIKTTQTIITAKKLLEAGATATIFSLTGAGAAKAALALGIGTATYFGLSSLEKTEDLVAPSDGSPLLLKRGQAPIQGIPDDNVIFTTNNISSLTNNTSLPIVNMQPLIDRLDKLERTLIEYRSVPVVIENSIDGRELNRNTINGLRKGYLITPSVYT
jgi:hypothetical protein